ncbi:MAG TPA: hypothetical protein VGP72_12145 [Planctomycetota bacterium]
MATTGSGANVNLLLEDVAKKCQTGIQSRLVDLLEIAAYVYAADCRAKRDGVWEDVADPEPWRRDFQFVIPVRDVAFWSSPETAGALAGVLNFLSDDSFAFTFVPARHLDAIPPYLALGAMEEWPFCGVERVALFSGGLDSFAGIVETANRKEKQVLVSHRPVSIKDNHQRMLFSELNCRFPASLVHVPVWVNKDVNMGREHTQRTRSFLYCALGATVAASVNAKGVRFFENGVISLNLPVADEVVGARASRTTHPHALHLFQQFFSRVLGRDCIVDNPYLFKTKTDIVSIIAANGCGDLIGKTVSCSHSFFKAKGQQHCGRCGQCIDRRIAVLAAGQADNDPETDYEVDVFTGRRDEGYEINIAVDYVRLATELNRWDEQQIGTRFNSHLGRAVRDLPNRTQAAQDFARMLKRHAEAATSVVKAQINAHSDSVMDGTLEKTSLLARVFGGEHRVACWRRFADRIVEVLRKGLPSLCATHAPEDEPRLQQICDGLLHASDINLRREFPYICWSSKLTKPDFASEVNTLIVELKYLREKKDEAAIVRAIAEDITKYGDSGYQVLFIVYDRQHFITDDDEFAEPIRKRPSMMVEFVR